MISWTDMIEITGAAELTAVALATQDRMLAMVAAQLAEDVWGDLYDYGCAYLVAHLATVGKRRGVGGFVVGESAGSVSRQYANSVAAGAATLGSTAYGTEYERLIGLLPGARFVAPW